MTRTHHWGSTINPAFIAEDAVGHVVTANDSTAVRVVGRPAQNTQIPVKLAPTLADQTPITLNQDGRWAYQLDLPDDVIGAIYLAGLDNTGQPALIGPAYSQETMEDLAAAALLAAQASAAASQAGMDAATAAQAATSAAGAAQAAQAAAEQSAFPGYVTWDQVREAPAITALPLSRLSEELVQVGSGYPIPNGQVGVHRFVGTASPFALGLMKHGDRWTEVKLT